MGFPEFLPGWIVDGLMLLSSAGVDGMAETMSFESLLIARSARCHPAANCLQELPWSGRGRCGKRRCCRPRDCSDDGTADAMPLASFCVARWDIADGLPKMDCSCAC